jgi:hypothetical protein
MGRRGKISLEKEKAQLFLAEISNFCADSISLKKFLKENMEVFLKSNATLKQIYEMFKKHEIEVGTYAAFASCFRTAKRDYLKTKDELEIHEEQKDQ